MNALLHYDRACHALAEAKAIDEVKDILDKAVALEMYGRQAKNRDLEIDAAEIRFRAERRLGQVEVEMHREGRIHRGGRPKNEVPETSSKTEGVLPVRLADLGIDHKLSSRAQKLAAVPDSKFEGMLGGMRERLRAETDRVTRDLLKEGMQAEARAAHAASTADGCTVDDLRELARTGRTFGAIAADPAWHFAARGPRGEGRSAGQHYGTQRLDEIMALPIGDLAASDAVLFLWVMDWDEDLAMARSIINAWGFVHKTTAFTWAKLNPSGEGYHMGQGYWTRANPEICLLATRGTPKRLNADVRQLIVTPVMEHSRKPDEAYEGIRRLVGGPYLELNARRPRDNWTVWGNEIPRADFDASEGMPEPSEMTPIPDRGEGGRFLPVDHAWHAEAIAMRKDGVKIFDIAVRFGKSPSNVHKIVTRGLAAETAAGRAP